MDFDKEFKQMLEGVKLPSNHEIHRETVRIENSKRNKERVAKLMNDQDYSDYMKTRNSNASKKRWSSLSNDERLKQIEHCSSWHKSENSHNVYEKISIAKKINHPLRGKKQETETLDKISKSLKGRIMNRKKYYELHTPEGVFENVKSAAEHYNRKPDTISKWINKQKQDEFYWVKKNLENEQN